MDLNTQIPRKFLVQVDWTLPCSRSNLADLASSACLAVKYTFRKTFVPQNCFTIFRMLIFLMVKRMMVRGNVRLVVYVFLLLPNAWYAEMSFQSMLKCFVYHFVF